MRAIILLLLLATPLPAREAVSIIINNDDLRDEVDDVLDEYRRACDIHFVRDGQRKPYIMIGWDSHPSTAVIAWTDADLLNNDYSVVHLNANWHGFRTYDEQTKRRVRFGAIRHEFMHALAAMEHSDDRADVSNGLGSIPKWFSPTEVAILQGWYGDHGRLVIPNWLDPLIAQRRAAWASRKRAQASLSLARSSIVEWRARESRQSAAFAERRKRIRAAVDAGQLSLAGNLRSANARTAESLRAIRGRIRRLESEIESLQASIASSTRQAWELSQTIDPEMRRYN